MEALRLALSQYLSCLQIAAAFAVLCAVIFLFAHVGRLTLRYLSLRTGNAISIVLFLIVVPVALMWISLASFAPLPDSIWIAPEMLATRFVVFACFVYFSLGYLLEWIINVL